MRTVLRRTALIVAVLFASVLGAPALPAAAHPLRGQIGTFVFVWEPGYDHQLCKFSTGCIRYGNIVRLWQSILWADGRMANLDEIDGEFGPKTHDRTVSWQSQYVPGDLSGKVGPNTWGAADNKLIESVYHDVGFYYYHYEGSHHRLDLRQQNTGYWQFFNPRTGAWIWADH